MDVSRCPDRAARVGCLSQQKSARLTEEKTGARV
jgi:hypothetical protein